MTFYKWLKENSEVTPPEKLDRAIIGDAKKKLVKKNYSFTAWSMVSLAMIILLVVKILINNDNHMKLAMISEPIELIDNYQYIELMADASVLSAEDWEKLK